MIEIPITINTHGLDTERYDIGGILIANIGRCSPLEHEYRYLYMLHNGFWHIVKHDRRESVYVLLQTILNDALSTDNFDKVCETKANATQAEISVVNDFYKRIEERKSK